MDKKGRVNFAQTDVLIHVVNKQTNRILDVERFALILPIPSLLKHFLLFLYDVLTFTQTSVMIICGCLKG